MSREVKDGVFFGNLPGSCWSSFDYTGIISLELEGRMALNLFLLLPIVALGAIATVVLLGIVFIFMTTDRKPDRRRYDNEKYFIDPVATSNKKRPFPSLDDDPSVDLSVIVPSYNEELRLPVMLDEAIGVLESRKKERSFTYEIIVVDDGSKDATTKVALDYSKKYGTDHIRVLTLVKNRGKGGAVRLGMFSARGRNLLFADADGATKFADLEKLEEALSELKTGEDNLAIVCGSRAHLEEESITQRSFFRTFLMYGFHFLVWFLCVRGVRDTQCGFKVMTRQTAARLFSNLHVNRWAFDVELLYIAQAIGVPIAEVAVHWHEIDGSKMVPVFSWIQMGKDLLLIRLRYLLGIWSIKAKPE